MSHASVGKVLEASIVNVWYLQKNFTVKQLVMCGLTFPKDATPTLHFRRKEVRLSLAGSLIPQVVEPDRGGV